MIERLTDLPIGVDGVRAKGKITRAMMPCPVKVFGNGQWQDAIAWLTSSNSTAGITQRLLSERGVLLVEPTGPLRADDFDALALVVDPWIEAHGTLRGLVIHVQEFPGWENLGGLLRHLHSDRDETLRPCIVQGRPARFSTKVHFRAIDRQCLTALARVIRSSKTCAAIAPGPRQGPRAVFPAPPRSPCRIRPF